MLKKTYNSTKILGQNIVSSSKNDLLKFFKNHISSSSKLVSVFTPNPEQIVIAKSYKSFDKTLGFADIRIPDGVGLVYGSLVLDFFGKSKVIQERITGVDVVTDLLGWLLKKTSAEEIKQKKVLILGGRGYANQKILDFVVSQIIYSPEEKSGVKIEKDKTLYWYEGFLNVSVQTEDEQTAIQKVIKKLQPDIVFVAFGAPYQEEWVEQNYKLLKSAQVCFVMVVGGAFDMLSGKLSRAPKFMRKIGLEWLFRLYKEPWRWRRQLKLVKFVKLLVQEVLG